MMLIQLIHNFKLQCTEQDPQFVGIGLALSVPIAALMTISKDSPGNIILLKNMEQNINNILGMKIKHIGDIQNDEFKLESFNYNLGQIRHHLTELNIESNNHRKEIQAKEINDLKEYVKTSAEQIHITKFMNLFQKMIVSLITNLEIKNQFLEIINKLIGKVSRDNLKIYLDENGSMSTHNINPVGIAKEVENKLLKLLTAKSQAQGEQLINQLQEIRVQMVACYDLRNENPYKDVHDSNCQELFKKYMDSLDKEHEGIKNFDQAINLVYKMWKCYSYNDVIKKCINIIKNIINSVQKGEDIENSNQNMDQQTIDKIQESLDKFNKSYKNIQDISSTLEALKNIKIITQMNTPNKDYSDDYQTLRGVYSYIQEINNVNYDKIIQNLTKIPSLNKSIQIILSEHLKYLNFTNIKIWFTQIIDRLIVIFSTIQNSQKIIEQNPNYIMSLYNPHIFQDHIKKPDQYYSTTEGVKEQYLEKYKTDITNEKSKDKVKRCLLRFLESCTNKNIENSLQILKEIPREISSITPNQNTDTDINTDKNRAQYINLDSILQSLQKNQKYDDIIKIINKGITQLYQSVTNLNYQRIKEKFEAIINKLIETFSTMQEPQTLNTLANKYYIEQETPDIQNAQPIEKITTEFKALLDSCNNNNTYNIKNIDNSLFILKTIKKQINAIIQNKDNENDMQDFKNKFFLEYREINDQTYENINKKIFNCINELYNNLSLLNYSKIKQLFISAIDQLIKIFETIQKSKDQILKNNQFKITFDGSLNNNNITQKSMPASMAQSTQYPQNSLQHSNQAKLQNLNFKNQNSLSTQASLSSINPPLSSANQSFKPGMQNVFTPEKYKTSLKSPNNFFSYSPYSPYSSSLNNQQNLFKMNPMLNPMLNPIENSGKFGNNFNPSATSGKFGMNFHNKF